MRRLFLPFAALTLLSLIGLAAGLFHLSWIPPGSAHRIMLRDASLHIWLGSRGDWAGFRHSYGLDTGGWTGHRWRWKPLLDPDARIYVQTAPPAAGVATVAAKPITGVMVILPWYLPVLIFGAGAIAAFPAWRRHRRPRRGQCPGCGYDLAGLRDRCPECGEAVPPQLRAPTHPEST